MPTTKPSTINPFIKPSTINHQAINPFIMAIQPTPPRGHVLNPQIHKGLIAGQNLRETNGFHKAGYFWGGYVAWGGRLTSHNFKVLVMPKPLSTSFPTFVPLGMTTSFNASATWMRPSLPSYMQCNTIQRCRGKCLCYYFCWDDTTLAFHNPPNTLWVGVWNPKRPSQEVFGDPNTYSQGIWKTRANTNHGKPLDLHLFVVLKL